MKDEMKTKSVLKSSKTRYRKLCVAWRYSFGYLCKYAI